MGEWNKLRPTHCMLNFHTWIEAFVSDRRKAFCEFTGNLCQVDAFKVRQKRGHQRSLEGLKASTSSGVQLTNCIVK